MDTFTTIAAAIAAALVVGALTWLNARRAVTLDYLSLEIDERDSKILSLQEQLNDCLHASAAIEKSLAVLEERSKHTNGGIRDRVSSIEEQNEELKVSIAYWQQQQEEMAQRIRLLELERDAMARAAQREGHGTDMLAAYEEALRRLRSAAQGKTWEADYLIQDTRLTENIARARRYGDDEANQADRMRVIDALNRVLLRCTGRGFETYL